MDTNFPLDRDKDDQRNTNLRWKHDHSRGLNFPPQPIFRNGNFKMLPEGGQEERKIKEFMETKLRLNTYLYTKSRELDEYGYGLKEGNVINIKRQLSGSHHFAPAPSAMYLIKVDCPWRALEKYKLDCSPDGPLPVLESEFSVKRSDTAEGQPSEPSEDEYLLQINLPVDPIYRTASEAATLQYLHLYSLYRPSNHPGAKDEAIQFPEVLDYDCTADNTLGFEWILMKFKEPGQFKNPIEFTRFGLWDKITETKKWDFEEQPDGSNKLVCQSECVAGESNAAKFKESESMIRQLGKFFGDLQRDCNFPAIGSLYHRKDLSERLDPATGIIEVPKPKWMDANADSKTGWDFVIGPLVLQYYQWWSSERSSTEPTTWGNRGPYRTESSYMLGLCDTRLALIDCKLSLKADFVRMNDPDSKKGYDDLKAELEKHRSDIATLQSLITTVFPSPPDTDTNPIHQQTPLVLNHYKLSLDDIQKNKSEGQIAICYWNNFEVTPTWDYGKEEPPLDFLSDDIQKTCKSLLPNIRWDVDEATEKSQNEENKRLNKMIVAEIAKAVGGSAISAASEDKIWNDKHEFAKLLRGLVIENGPPDGKVGEFAKRFRG